MLANTDPSILARQRYEETFDWADSVFGDHPEWQERSEALWATRRAYLGTVPETRPRAIELLEFCRDAFEGAQGGERMAMLIDAALDRLAIHRRSKRAVGELELAAKEAVEEGGFDEEAVGLRSAVAFLRKLSAEGRGALRSSGDTGVHPT